MALPGRPFSLFTAAMQFFGQTDFSDIEKQELYSGKRERERGGGGGGAAFIFIYNK